VRLQVEATVQLERGIPWHNRRQMKEAKGAVTTMNTGQGILLSTDLRAPMSIPYFLWDEPMTTAEFRRRLSAASAPEQARLLAKLLRQARDTDVWHFTTPAEIRDRWPVLAPLLGRRRPFWEFLLRCWQKEGLLSEKST
jgi:hypothetical protein